MQTSQPQTAVSPGNIVKFIALNQTAGLKRQTWGQNEGPTEAKLYKVRKEN